MKSCRRIFAVADSSLRASISPVRPRFICTSCEWEGGREGGGGGKGGREEGRNGARNKGRERGIDGGREGEMGEERKEGGRRKAGGVITFLVRSQTESETGIPVHAVGGSGRTAPPPPSHSPHSQCPGHRHQSEAARSDRQTNGTAVRI